MSQSTVETLVTALGKVVGNKGYERRDTSDPIAWQSWAQYDYWRRATCRWELNTAIPVPCRADRLLEKIPEDLKIRTSHLMDKVLQSADGVQAILRYLDSVRDHKAVDTTTELINDTLFGWMRASHETLSQFGERQERTYALAQEGGLPLPDWAKRALTEAGADLKDESSRRMLNALKEMSKMKGEP